jgi:hypothetical protein
MEAKVDIAEQTGAPLTSTAASTSRSNSTQAFEPQAAAADRMVHDIIAANLGKPGTRLSSAAPSLRQMALSGSAVQVRR